MEDITQQLGTNYYPYSALVFYKSDENYDNFYVEHFDMAKNGIPINAHPLTLEESKQLSKMLNIEQEQKNTCFIPNGLLPNTILHLNPTDNGQVIWYNKPQKRQLYFIENLGIPNGMAYMPTLIFKATKTGLSVYALKSNRRPTMHTKLYYAPFFNIYEDGKICMGTVDIKVSKVQSLEEFISLWEDHFFNSYFAHLLDSYNPIKSNIVAFWQQQINTDKPFETKELKRNNRTLKDII